MGLAPGRSAGADLLWDSGGALADRTHDQVVTVRIVAGDVWEEHTRPEVTVAVPGGGSQLDVLDGQVMRVGHWSAL